MSERWGGEDPQCISDLGAYFRGLVQVFAATVLGITIISFVVRWPDNSEDCDTTSDAVTTPVIQNAMKSDFKVWIWPTYPGGPTLESGIFVDLLIVNYRGNDPITITAINLNDRGAQCIPCGHLRKLPATMKLGDEIF